MKLPRSFFTLLGIALAGLLFFPTPSSAQSPASGTIEGRVVNTRNGEYLERARVTVDAAGLEAFTDSAGYYRLVNVPVGVVRMKIFYTGLDAQTDSVAVAAGATVQRDFSLTAGGKSGEAVVKLDQFVVATTKEMDGAAIAINEQRFAPNIMNVVSADEFGSVVEGNVGDFLKFLPGITVDVGGGDARTISMNGVPSNNVPITIGGFSLASAQSSGTARTVELEQVSVNNIARFEVQHSPTPESQGAALAGSVNMVPRSAFERSRPVFSGSVFLMMKDNYKSLRKTPGPRAEPTVKVRPGYDFSWVVPVNRRFGFTVSSAYSNQYTSEDFSQNNWRGVGATTTGLTVTTNTTQYPDTAFNQPYLTDYAVQDANKFSRRTSFGATVDYKLAANDRVSFSFQWALFDAELSNRKLTFLVQRVSPGNFTTDYTHGDAGRGEVQLNNTGMRQKSGTTYMPTLTWRHDGPIWKAEAGVGHSHASNHYKDSYRGFFNNSLARRSGVTINFDDIFYLRPNRITVTDAAGAPVDPYNLASYALSTASNQEQESADLQRSAFGNVRRDFSVRGFPLALKAGFDLRQSVRDIRKYAPSWNFVGDDNRQVTTPVGNDASHNSAGVLDANFSQRYAPFGFPQVQWVSQEKLWELYVAHPEYFSINTANSAYRSLIDQSKRAEEIISAAYLRGDAAFFERRLKFTGGVRAEQTNVTGQGPLTDPTRDFQRDASGTILRDSAGKPLLLVPTNAGIPYSQLTYLDRGERAQKEYLRLFPSLNASYNLRENLIARGSVYSSIGRPDYNQYTNGLALPDTDAVPDRNNNRISVNNVGIKPWSARTAKVRVEYYFDRVGQVSVGAFRRDFKNFFGSIIQPATPEFLALYNLDPAVYGNFDVSTNYNLPTTVRMEGLEFDYKQALTFLPPWARGVQVFANASAQRATGAGADNFTGFVPRSGSWGVSLTRQKFTLKSNWNYRGRQRQGALSGRGIEAGSYEWGSKRMGLDVYGEYRLTRGVSAFASLKNVTGQDLDFKRFGPSTPKIAQFRQRQDYSSAWVFGLRGSF